MVFYQIMTRMDEVYELYLPSDVRRLLNVFGTGVSLGLGSSHSVLSCMGLDRYVVRLALWMLLPTALVALILFGSALRLLLRRSCSPGALVAMALPALVRILFLIYPLVANFAFEAFSCYEFDDGSQFLQIDVAVSCIGPLYTDTIYPLAMAGVAFNAFGLVLLNACLLLCARKAIIEQRVTPLSKSILFLYREYEPWAFWWELLE